MSQSESLTWILEPLIFWSVIGTCHNQLIPDAAADSNSLLVVELQQTFLKLVKILRKADISQTIGKENLNGELFALLASFSVLG